jgi:predicted membrane-bound mannosyltransferase
MGTILMAAAMYVTVASLIGYGLAHPRCPSWVLVVVGLLMALGAAGILMEIFRRDPWRITVGDALDLLLPTSFLAATVIAQLIRSSRIRKRSA